MGFSGLNRHAHLHAAVTDGVFLSGTHGPDGPPAFLPVRPLTATDLAALTERVRRVPAFPGPGVIFFALGRYWGQATGLFVPTVWRSCS